MAVSRGKKPTLRSRSAPRCPEIGPPPSPALRGGDVLHADAKAELSLSDAADHPRALHGRRKGRPLRRQRAGLIETLLPGLALPLHRPAPNPLTALFSPPVRAVRMEIGFGGGEHLTAAAELLRDTGFIGCEPFLNGMARALSLIETKRLANIRLHFGDAAEVIAWLPRRRARARRPPLSRPLAEAAPLEAALHPGRKRRRRRTRACRGRRASICDRLAGLRRLDA